MKCVLQAEVIYPLVVVQSEHKHESKMKSKGRRN